MDKPTSDPGVPRFPRSTQTPLSTPLSVYLYIQCSYSSLSEPGEGPNLEPDSLSFRHAMVVAKDDAGAYSSGQELFPDKPLGADCLNDYVVRVPGYPTVGGNLSMLRNLLERAADELGRAAVNDPTDRISVRNLVSELRRCLQRPALPEEGSGSDALALVRLDVTERDENGVLILHARELVVNPLEIEHVEVLGDERHPGMAEVEMVSGLEYLVLDGPEVITQWGRALASASARAGR